MDNVAKQARTIIVMLTVTLLSVAGLAACSGSGRTMTDDEIRALVSEGDEATLEQVKAETQIAIDEALADMDMDDERRTEISNAVSRRVGERLDRIEGGTSAQSKPQQGTHRRIEDGTPVAISWSAPTSYVEHTDAEHTLTTTVTGFDAKAYNFASDTPYAGGGYAYKVIVTVHADWKFEHLHGSSGSDISVEPGFTVVKAATIGALLEPYGLRISQPGDAGDYVRDTDDDWEYTYTFQIDTNLVPERVTIESIDF